MAESSMSEYINSVLDQNEKNAVEQFASSEVMFEAVKKVVVAGLYKNGVLRAGVNADPRRNAAFAIVDVKEFSDAQVGADIRALWQGLNALEAAFAEIEKFKPQTEEERSQSNPAR